MTEWGAVLQNRLSSDALVMLADFGETIVYRPAGDAPRSIQAIVDRHAAEDLGVGESLRGWNLLIAVANDETRGIPTAAFAPGRDQVEIAERCGGPPQARTLTKLVSHDAALAQYEVR